MRDRRLDIPAGQVSHCGFHTAKRSEDPTQNGHQGIAKDACRDHRESDHPGDRKRRQRLRREIIVVRHADLNLSQLVELGGD